MEEKNEPPKDFLSALRKRPLVNLNGYLHPVIDDFIDQQNMYNEIGDRHEQLKQEFTDEMKEMLEKSPEEQLEILTHYCSEYKRIRLDLQVLHPNYFNAYNAFSEVAKQNEEVMYELSKLSPWLSPSVVEGNKTWVEGTLQNHEAMIALLEKEVQKSMRNVEDHKRAAIDPYLLLVEHPCIATYWKHHKHFLKTTNRHNQYVERFKQFEEEMLACKTTDEHIKVVNSHLHELKQLYEDVKSVINNYYPSYNMVYKEGMKNEKVMQQFRRLEKAISFEGMRDLRKQWNEKLLQYEKMIRDAKNDLRKLNAPETAKQQKPMQNIKGHKRAAIDSRLLFIKHPCIEAYWKHHKQFLKTTNRHNQYVERFKHFKEEAEACKTTDEQIKLITTHLHLFKQLHEEVKSASDNYYHSYNMVYEEGKKNEKVMQQFRIIEKAISFKGMEDLKKQMNEKLLEYEKMIKKGTNDLQRLNAPETAKQQKPTKANISVKNEYISIILTDCEFLTGFMFQNSNFNAATVNNILISINKYGTSNGEILLDGDDNDAPTGEGIVAMNQLISRGWKVITNPPLVPLPSRFSEIISLERFETKWSGERTTYEPTEDNLNPINLGIGYQKHNDAFLLDMWMTVGTFIPQMKKTFPIKLAVRYKLITTNPHLMNNPQSPAVIEMFTQIAAETYDDIRKEFFRIKPTTPFLKDTTLVITTYSAQKFRQLFLETMKTQVDKWKTS